MKTNLEKILNHIAFVALLILALMIAPGAMAQHYNGSDGYVTAVATTNSTTSAVCFSGQPGKTIRLTGLSIESASASGYLQIFAGSAPYTVTGVINGTNLVVSSNVGVVTNRPCILQFGGTNWIATVLYTNNATNIVLAGGSTLGFTPLTNATFWHCANVYQDQIGIAKRQLTGDALFAAPTRGPLAVQVTPAIAYSNNLAATVWYGTDGAP